MPLSENRLPDPLPRPVVTERRLRVLLDLPVEAQRRALGLPVGGVLPEKA